jgi:hypothetical protein
MLHKRNMIEIGSGLLVLLAVSTACGGNSNPSTTSSAAADANQAGDIPDNQAFVAYTASDGSFTVQVPEGWAKTDSGTGVVFSDKLNSIGIESRTGVAAPTVESVRSTELPALAAATHGYLPGEVSSVDRKAGTAVRITYRADSAPSPVTGKTVVDAVERYDFYRSGQEVVLTLSAPVGADNVDPWQQVTDSFSWSR